jgi:bifunctional non-homologous end joining protein LigD
MTKAVWLKPEAVAHIEFLQWTEADRLRHSKFVGLREEKNPRSVVKEQTTALRSAPSTIQLEEILS